MIDTEVEQLISPRPYKGPHMIKEGENLSSRKRVKELNNRLDNLKETEELVVRGGVKEDEGWTIPKEMYLDLGKTSGTITLSSSLPVPVGYYKIGGNLYVQLTQKPNMIHRYFTKLLLGWEWVETDNNKKY